MYCHNHAFIDPNLWFQEDELRKQIEQFAHCFIFTGQEAPQGHRRVREDLYKKTMSANGIAGRKPYGAVTRMLSLVGWKRLEVNHMFTFQGVTSENFNSLLRRSFVWRPKARFIDSGTNNVNEAVGLFAADPSLRDFLVSGPAILAALVQQHAFEALYTREACRDLIEEYVRCGDGGCTTSVMKEACGLSALEEDNEDEAEQQAQRLNLMGDVVNELLSKRSLTFAINFSVWKKLTSLDPGKEKDLLWKTLQSKQLLLPAHRVPHSYFPAIPCSSRLHDVCHLLDISCPTLQEKLHVEALRCVLVPIII